VTTNVQTGPELREDRGGQTLSEDISIPRGCGQMKNADVNNGHTLTDEVKIDLDVLGTLMLNRVVANVEGFDVVVVDQCGAPKRGA